MLSPKLLAATTLILTSITTWLAAPPLHESDGARGSEAAPRASSDVAIDDEALLVDAVRRALASVDGAPDRVRGEETIEGIVIARDGTPVAGATVMTHSTGGLDTYATLTTDRSWRGKGFDRVESDADAVRDAAANAAASTLRQRRQRLFTTTDADGRFAFTDLPEAGYRVQVYAKGYRYKSALLHAGQGVEVTLDRVAVLDIEPRMPDGSVAARALVHTGRRNSSGHLQPWDPANPHVTIDEPDVLITAVAGDILGTAGTSGPLATFRSQAYSVDVGGDADTVTLALQKRSVLRVEIQDSLPVMDGLWHWVELRRPGAADGTRLARLQDGRFGIEAPGPGAYEVVARRGTFGATATVEVALEEGLNDRVLRLPPMEPNERLVVRCVGPSGEPVLGAELTDVTRPTGAPRPFRIGSLERPGGVHWVSASLLDQVRSRHADQRLRIAANSARFGVASAEVPATAHEIELRFDEPCALTLVAQSERTTDIGVVLRRSDDEPPERRHASRRTRLDANELISTGSGVWFANVTPGAYRLYYYVVDDNAQGYLVQSIGLELESGERSIELPVPELSTLEVTVPGAREGQMLRLEKRPPIPDDLTPPSVRISAEGVAVFTEVPSGVYFLSIRTSAGQFEEQVFVPSEPITLTPR